jgi:hypothetical protein
MSLAIGALLLQSFYLLLIVVFFMGAQSALFAPSKIGKIPDVVGREPDIQTGTGCLTLATLSAVVIGMACRQLAGGCDGLSRSEQIGLTTAVLVGIAILGTVLSF